MKYYVLRHHTPGSAFIDGDVVFLPALTDHYQVGKNLVPPDTRLELVLDRRAGKIQADFFLTSSGAFFASAGLKDVLRRHRTSLDFFPADARHADGSPTAKPYFLVHVSGKVACLDHVNADYAGKSMVLARIAGGTFSADYQVRGIKQRRIVEARTAGLDFFFVDGAIWLDPLISELVLEDARAAGLDLDVEAI